MTPKDSIQRLLQLGATLELSDLPRVQRLYISEKPTSPEHADLVASMSPESVTLNGSLMTVRDIPCLMQLVSLQSIVAHRIGFAGDILRQTIRFGDLQSVAMAHTSVDDADVLVLENRSGLRSIRFAGTQISDTAMKVFGTLPDLELLDIRDTSITTEGLSYLRGLRHLLTVDVTGTVITAQDASRYQKTVKHLLPDLEVLV